MPNYRVNGNSGIRRMNCGCSNGYENMRNQRVSSDGCAGSGKIVDCREHSGCCEKEHVPDDMPIAMAYVPWQRWKCIYEAGKGFHRGTIFEELDLPFCGKGGCNS